MASKTESVVETTEEKEEVATEQSAEVTTETEAGAETTDVKDTDVVETKTAEAVIANSTPPVVETKPTANVLPHHVAFFEQYIDFVKERKADQAIRALNNSIKAMLKAGSNEAFNAVFKMFKANKTVLAPEIRLQSVSILSNSERAIAEVIFTIFHVLVNNQKSPIDLDTARRVVKNEAFINWCAKKLG